MSRLLDASWGSDYLLAGEGAGERLANMYLSLRLL